MFPTRGVCGTMFTFQVIFSTFKPTTASKTPKNGKIKRDFAFGEDQGDKMSARDVQIIPEKQYVHWGGRNRHPAHRDRDGDRDGDTKRSTMHEGRTWSPRPFEATAEQHLSASEEVTIGQKAEEREKLISGLARGLVSSVRLKGIYMQPVSKRGNHWEEKFNYSKEINNLMQKGFRSAAENRKPTLKKAFKGHGAPFKLPEEGNEKRSAAARPFALTKSRRGRPMTILLDFYPMKEMADRFHNGKLVESEEGNGIIMKLNLYPRKGARKEGRGKVLHRHMGKPLENVNKTAEKKSFGWFSKDKQKRTNRPKECSLMGLNPHGKHITAKWKDKNGDWIHAKRVVVKYSQKENH